MSVQCHLATIVGRRAEYIVLWGGRGDCPGNTFGHRAAKDLGDWPDDKPPSLQDPAAYDWTGSCGYCGQTIPWERREPCTACDPPCGEQRPVVRVAGGTRAVYDTPDGELGPGAMYVAPCRACTWHNCPGEHLHVVLPNGHHWDVDSRASNCTLPDDRTHRCWIREGEPPNVTAGKNGHTCTAGAGSIQSGDYHGFLQGGVLT